MFTYIKSDAHNYPKSLKTSMLDAPALTIIGNDSHINLPALAVVGCDLVSEYGYCVLKAFIPTLGFSGLVIVTELFGETAETVITLAIAYNLPVIGVLAMGFAWIPTTNTYTLIKTLGSYPKGCVISPFAADARQDPKTYIATSSVIAGLALAVLVVESYTPSYMNPIVTEALEMGKSVYGVPGDIFARNSKGTNELIRSGGVLVTSPKDVLEDLKF